MTINLRHLTVVGPNLPSASIEFGESLTVVYGATDTGKTYIADAIDFMLGAKDLKTVPEASGYTQALLGITLSSGNLLTLCRNLSGGPFQVYRADVRDVSARTPDFHLSPTHESANHDNLSRFLLRELYLDNAKIRVNARNETNNLSFRQLARLCIVDETSMQATESPVTSGHKTRATAEKSVFKILVEGKDDSSLVAEPSRKEKNITQGKVEALDNLIAQLEDSLPAQEDQRSLTQQAARLEASISEQTRSIYQLIQRRDTISNNRAEAERRAKEQERRLSEIGEMLARFTLLAQQYNSDLARLEMVAEAGNLLGYFGTGVCVFCGAAVEHQRTHEHQITEMTGLAESVAVETARTNALRNDLGKTLQSLEEQRTAGQENLREIKREIEDLDQGLRAIETELAPDNSALSDLLTLRSSLERTIGMFDQIEQVREMRIPLTTQVAPTKRATRTVEPMSSRFLNFSSTLRDILTAWRVPDAADSRFDRSVNDVLVGDQPRSNRGKGMRAILHAGFSVALFRHSMEYSTGHPGFIVLDSPLVTYRGPDGVAVARDPSDEAIGDDVAAQFFRYLQAGYGGQVLVLENTDPPEDVASMPSAYRFTKTHDLGRYGFFPVDPES